jgi:hypothetical protein
MFPASARRALVPILVAGALLASLTACTNGATPRATASPLPATYGTFSGYKSGRIYLNLCDATGNDSIWVVLKGTTTRLPGELSASTMTFNASDSIYSIVTSAAQPKFADGGQQVSLDGVILASVLKPSRRLTFAGTVTCP